MDESTKKRRKTVSVYDERSRQYQDYPADPKERTMVETIKEAFAPTATAADLATARKRRGFK